MIKSSSFACDALTLDRFTWARRFNNIAGCFRLISNYEGGSSEWFAAITNFGKWHTLHVVQWRINQYRARDVKKNNNINKEMRWRNTSESGSLPYFLTDTNLHSKYLVSFTLLLYLSIVQRITLSFNTPFTTFLLWSGLDTDPSLNTNKRRNIRSVESYLSIGGVSPREICFSFHNFYIRCPF